MFQQITLIGNLGATPEMRYTASGVAVTSFRLAVNRRWTSAEGEQKQKTTWFNVTAWRRQAEIINQYLEKGSKVLVVGEVEEARPYVDRDGNQRAAIEIKADEVRFLDGRSQNGSANGSANGSMNGTANGSSNGAANGSTNGVAQATQEAVVDLPL